MKVVIQFNDENKELAAAIGLGLMSYGDPDGSGIRLPDDKTTTTTEKSTTKKVGDVELTETETVKTEPAATTGPVGDDLATLDEWVRKYGDPGDWSRVPDHLIPSKEVFPGVDEDAVADAIGKAGQADAGDVQTDEKGVPFDAAFCAVSKVKPFYATGPRTGQWKKKRGLDVDEYDLWYAGQLTAVDARIHTDEPEPGKVDTAAAFAGPGSAPAPGDATLPTTPGDLMKWCAEQTAGGSMTTEEVTAAYAACGITVADMFGPEGETHVQNVLAVLLQ